MRTNTQFTVSVQMLILIAISDGKRITSAMLAESTGCNPVMVRQLFAKLKEAGLLRISAGKGTTGLAREASAISLWDVFAAVEGGGQEKLFSFHPNISKTCRVGGCYQAVLGRHLEDAVFAMKASLEQVSLEQLVREITSAAATGQPSGQ